MLIKTECELYAHLARNSDPTLYLKNPTAPRYIKMLNVSLRGDNLRYRCHHVQPVDAGKVSIRYALEKGLYTTRPNRELTLFQQLPVRDKSLLTCVVTRIDDDTFSGFIIPKTGSYDSQSGLRLFTFCRETGANQLPAFASVNFGD